jgi:hypothetical protein
MRLYSITICAFIYGKFYEKIIFDDDIGDECGA